MVRITHGAQNHAPIIREIALNTWYETFKDILSTQQIDYMLEQMYSLQAIRKLWRDGQQFLLAKHGRYTVGFLTMQHHYDDISSKIHRLYLLPEMHGKGIGKALLDTAATEAKKSDAQQLVLNVNRFNKAKDFYLKHGFIIEREEDIDIGNGYLMEDYVMRKTL